MSEELIIRSADGVTQVGAFRLTKTGLEVEGEPTFEQWQKAGGWIQRAAVSVQWWVGDWLNYGERQWGEMYAQAMGVTKLNYLFLNGKQRNHTVGHVIPWRDLWAAVGAVGFRVINETWHSATLAEIASTPRTTIPIRSAQ